MKALVYIYLAGVIAIDSLGGCAGPEKSPVVHEVKQYSVADFYKNVRCAGAGFSHDEKRLLVSSNRSGIYNAYAIPVGGGEPEPLTQSTKDSIFAATYFPNDSRILYT